MKRIVYIIGCIVLLMACSEPQEYRTLLERAQAVMDDHPDSALAILDSLGQHQADFGKHFRMQYQLHRMNALNKVDTLFHTTSEAKTLADYFNGHGSPNEQMLAYYLLGRAYFDIHEAPMSLSCYQTASEKADTTAPDCNYRQLSRVYGQMSDIFYQQGLYQQELDYLDLSIYYAYKGKDTLNAIKSLCRKTSSFFMLNQDDLAIKANEEASSLALKKGYKEISAAVLGGIIRQLAERGDVNKAKAYIERYESESGYFDSNRNIEKGREIFYYSKGCYYLMTNNLDSAEYFFRKELREGKDFNNQNAGARGLALLYQRTNRPDSSAKYALYSYEMNDSVYAHMTTKEIEQMQSLYDYSRNQMIAQKEKERAEGEHEKVVVISSLFFIIAIVTVIVIRHERRTVKEARQKYKRSVSDLANAQSDIVRLRSHISHQQELNKLIEDKEIEIARLSTEIDGYKKKSGQSQKASETLLQESSTYKNLQKSSAKAIMLTDGEWHNINVMVIEIFPGFYNFISSKKLELNDKEFKTCILARLSFIQKEVANMLGVSPAYISKIHHNLMIKLFGFDGKFEDLTNRLKEYS